MFWRKVVSAFRDRFTLAGKPPDHIIAVANHRAASGKHSRARAALRLLPLEAFCELLLEVPESAPALKKSLPSMASDEVQLHWTGACGKELMSPSREFMQAVEEASRKYRGVGIKGNVLDYGCGWGRLLRLLLWYVEPERIYATDPWDRSLDVCRQHNCPGQLAPCDYVPTALPFTKAFDLIYAFSVFTHLSEKTADAVLHVLRKSISRNGMLVITIRPGEYWNFHQDWRDGYTKEDVLARHEKEGFAFIPHKLEPINGDITYGDTSITLDFIRRRWPQWKIAGTTQSVSDPLQILVFLLPA
jgi:2-polyprenyl-3-methyl-5-hydroxy-6-metoxy-1,4-benzoquinol methylase